jgi:rubrerythrin
MADFSTQDDADGRGPEKLLTIGAYGETVAAYRYLVLSEKSSLAADHCSFAEMADERHEHKQRLQKVLAERFPDANPVLSPEEKALVVTGPRLLNVHCPISFPDVLEIMLESERKTASFYARCGPLISDGTLRSLFHRLAEEDAWHYQRLIALAVEAGVAPADCADAGR